jgi:hypothetical protein
LHHLAFMRAADPSAMRTLAILVGGMLTLVLTGSAAALLTPGRTLTAPAPVGAVAVTNRIVGYAVGRTKASCGSVVLWDTPRLGHWTFGTRTILGCDEGPSGGFGIPTVAVTGRRVLWLTAIGGNITDWDLWTATPTHPAARRLAFASSDTDGPSAIVLGQGAGDGVPYAVDDTITYVAGSGARLFRTSLGSRVALVTAGSGPGQARVIASLADGRVVVLSGTGEVLRSQSYDPDEVVAVALAATGPVVQTGRDVSVCCSPTGPFVTMLPPGAEMLDYRQRTIVYRKGTQVRARRVPSEADTLLRTISVKPWQSMPFATDPGGSAWADGRRVSYRTGPLR